MSCYLNVHYTLAIYILATTKKKNACIAHKYD